MGMGTLALYALFVLLVILQVADAWTTYVAKKQLGCAERNSFMDRLQNRHAATKAIWLGAVWLSLPILPIWALAVLCGMYGYVIRRNVNEIAKAKKPKNLKNLKT
jgi:hypothetical protein